MELIRSRANPLLDVSIASVGNNINGPSVIKVPEWIDRPLGTYYMYFAHHMGSYIRLAYADDLEGPWQLYRPGTLHISETPFPRRTVSLLPYQKTGVIRNMSELLFDIRHEFLKRIGRTKSYPHIASPDVHVDHENELIRMYYHGSGEDYYKENNEELGQYTCLATSRNGIKFSTVAEKLGRFYFRVFRYSNEYYALAKANRGENQEQSGFVIYKSRNGISNFHPGPEILHDGARHCGLRVINDTLQVFYTRIGDAPEHILVTHIDLTDEWTEWEPTSPIPVLCPETDYEGGNLPIEPSVSGSVYSNVRQLRDPEVFERGKNAYIFYTSAGEQGISIAKIVD